jgi:ATP-dependent Clp protease protease subunit
MAPFYRFRAATGSGTATLQIFDVIGLDGTGAGDFRVALAALTASTINVEINSPGGDVFDGIAIYNMLKASGKTIVTKVTGIAASAASVILMAGESREVPTNTFVMVHNPVTDSYGTAAQHRKVAEVLEKIGAGLVDTYAKTTGLSEARVKVLLAQDTWMTADEALALGFATKVTAAIEASASFPTARANLPAHVEAIFRTHAKGTAPTTSDIWANRNFNKGSSK